MDQASLSGITGSLWTSVSVVPSTGSTNADLLARDGPEGQVLVAESQTAGRGRMGRTWVSEPGAALTFSVLLRPVPVPAARRGWLPLLTGVAVASAVRDVSGVAAVLKWPNDVLVGSRKLAGILAEQAGDLVVIGIGLNVATSLDALPSSRGGLPATSLLVEGASVSREAVLAGILRELERRYVAFRDDPSPGGRGDLLAEYRGLCDTLGRSVRVELPGGRVLAGVAEDVDADGRLLVAPSPGGAPPTPVSAGDVIHVRLLRPALAPLRLCSCFLPSGRQKTGTKRREPGSATRGLTMSRMGFDRSLAAGEEAVMILRPHWKTLVRPILLTFVVVAVLLAGEVLIPVSKAAAAERLALAVVAIALIMWWLMYPLLRWRTTVYELTNRRMRLRDGIVARNGRDIPLSRITDVSFRKGPLDRLLGSGTLIVESAGEHGQLRLTEIPDVERVQATLFQLVEDERAHADRDGWQAAGP